MWIKDDLLKLKGKEMQVIDIDNFIDRFREEQFDGWFEPIEFTSKNRMFKWKEGYINIRYTKNKDTDTICMIDMVKIIDIEVFYE